MDTRHHDQNPGVQTAFAKDVRSLVSVIEDLGNPFEEESTVLDTKEITDHTSVKAVQHGGLAKNNLLAENASLKDPSRSMM